MQLIQHPHVIRLFEAIDTPGTLYLFMEYGDGGDLGDMIANKNRLAEKVAKRYFGQIISAMVRCQFFGLKYILRIT